jgi:hypothetical protein
MQLSQATRCLPDIRTTLRMSTTRGGLMAIQASSLEQEGGGQWSSPLRKGAEMGRLEEHDHEKYVSVSGQ